jgi:hypothetical protein
MLIDTSMPIQNSSDFWQDELQNLRILLFKYDQAIAELVAGKVSEYRLETGQSTQVVKRSDLGALQAARQSLMVQIDGLEQRISGGSVALIMPGW